VLGGRLGGDCVFGMYSLAVQSDRGLESRDIHEDLETIPGYRVRNIRSAMPAL